MTRYKTVFPGGFIRTTPLIGRWSARASDPACQLCRRASCAPAYLHVDLQMFVCDRCMGDVFDHGEAVAARLAGAAV